MSETTRYALAPESIEAYRIRVLFHCEELQRETWRFLGSDILSIRCGLAFDRFWICP
jgi:hypothetical protein